MWIFLISQIERATESDFKINLNLSFSDLNLFLKQEFENELSTGVKKNKNLAFIYVSLNGKKMTKCINDLALILKGVILWVAMFAILHSHGILLSRC